MNQRGMALLRSVMIAGAALVVLRGLAAQPSGAVIPAQAGIQVRGISTGLIDFVIPAQAGIQSPVDTARDPLASRDRPVVIPAQAGIQPPVDAARDPLAGRDPSAPGASDPDAIVVRVQTPHYQLDASGLRVPGYDTASLPGAPALPVYNTLVELPAEGDWQLAVQLTGTQVLTAPVDIPAAPGAAPAPIGPAGWSGLSQLPDVVPAIVRPDPAIYRANAFYPASPVQTGEVQIQRGRRYLPVRVFPFQYNPLTRQLRYQPEVLVTVRPQPVLTSARPAPAAPLPALPAVRIYTPARGLYHLTYPDLISAGVPITDVVPATLALTSLGQPIDLHVTDLNSNGQFDPGDEIIFYAEPYQGRYMTRNVYWLTYGGANGARMTRRGVTPTGGEPLVTTITQTLHIEYDRDYRSLYQRPDNADHWFDTQLDVSSLTGVFTKSVTYTLSLDDPITTTGMIELRAVLHGGQDDVTLNPDQSVSVRVNDHGVGVYQWEGSTDYTVTASVPATWLDAVTNTVTLETAVSQLPGITTYWVSPDWVEVSYPARALTQNDRQYIEGVASGYTDLAVSGFTTSTVVAYEVRDPAHPVIITSTQAEFNSGAYTLHVWDTDLPNPAYFLSTPSALLTPAAIELDSPSNWRSPAHDADYIAIVPRALWAPIDPLLAHRAAEGLRVAKVDVQDIYDEFSAGRIDPQAIRDFLTYAYHNWNGGGQPPQYVLLVGDGHYDYTGVGGMPLPNLIPPYLVYVDPWLGETAADNRYVSVDGPDDYVPDMAIGRLPANTITDVVTIVSKTLAYEAAPLGDWQQRVVYVADDCANAAGNFHALSDASRLNWLPSVYTGTTIYYGNVAACPEASYSTNGAMRTAIKAAFDKRALLVQWFGHGSRFRWGSVSMFNVDDPPTLAQNTAWPFSLAFTCWSGYFVNLIDAGNPTWYQTQGETLMITPGRGSVADLSPSGLHIGGALNVMDQGVTKAVFQDRIDRAGLAVMAGKLYYYTHAGSDYDVIDTFIYFGDPALRLPTYATQLTPPAAALSGGPGAVVTYTLHVTNAAYLTDTLLLTTTGQAWPTSLSASVITLPGGLSADFVVSVTAPALLAGNWDSVRVIVTPQGSTIRAEAVLTTTVAAAYNFAVQAQPDQQGGAPGASVSYTVQVTNTGNLSDTIAFTTTGHAWPAAVAPAEVQLPPFGATQIVVSTTVPAATLAGARDVISVTATSQGGLLTQAVPLTTAANARYAVGLSPTAAVHWGQPGTNVTYTMQVANAGNITDTFAVGLSGYSWPSTASVAQVGPLAAGSVEAVDVFVAIPSSAPIDAVDELTVTLTSEGGGGSQTAQLTSVVTTTVFGLALESDIMERQADPGKMVTYTLRLTNTGGTTDTFTVGLAGNRWAAQAGQATVGPLAALLGSEVVVSVTVPADALPTSYDVVTVSGTSQANGARVSRPLKTTVAVAYGVALSPLTAWQTGRSGGVVTYTLALTNTGNFTDSFSITSGGQVWPVSVPAAITALPARTAANFVATVTLPYVWQVVSDTGVITATSQASRVQATTQLVTTAQPYRAFLPVLRR